MGLAVPASRLVLPVALLTACGAGSLSAADREERCATFARSVSLARLASTPSEGVARDVANSLDGLLPRMSSPDLHGPAVELHQDLHRIEKFARRGDSERADRAAESAREQLTKLAGACELPVERFLQP